MAMPGGFVISLPPLLFWKNAWFRWLLLCRVGVVCGTFWSVIASYLHQYGLLLQVFCMMKTIVSCDFGCCRRELEHDFLSRGFSVIRRRSDQSLGYPFSQPLYEFLFCRHLLCPFFILIEIFVAESHDFFYERRAMVCDIFFEQMKRVVVG